MLRGFRVWAPLIVLLVGAITGAADRSVTLAWDLNPAPDIAGYIVRYGVESGVYLSSTNLPGQASTVTLANLPPLDSLFFAAYCYDTNGVESPPSDEVFICNNPPTISSIPNQTTVQDVPIPGIPFTIRDPETAPANLEFSVMSSNTRLLPEENIILAGTDTNRTVSLIPSPGQFGLVAVWIFVSDGCSTINTAFRLIVRNGTSIPRPRIGTLIFDNNLGMYWQNWTNSYELQSTSSLTPPVHWQTIENFPAVADPASVITTSRPIAGSNQFFRVLAKP